jgi:hypothetical protein
MFQFSGSSSLSFRSECDKENILPYLFLARENIYLKSLGDSPMTDSKYSADEKSKSTAPLIPPSGNTSFWRKHTSTTAALTIAVPLVLAGFVMLIFTFSNRDRAHAAKDFLKSHSIAGDNGASNATIISMLSAIVILLCFMILAEICEKALKPKSPISTPLSSDTGQPLISDEKSLTTTTSQVSS